MATLGSMKARGEGIILYCEGNVGVRWCNHNHTPSMDQLIQYFGVDYDVVENRAALLGRFVCERCGGRQATLQILSGPDPTGKQLGPGRRAHDHGQPLSIEEATRWHHEREAERKRLGIKTNEEANRESRLRLQAAKKEARSGADFIGPPNPWAHRKGRWL